MGRLFDSKQFRTDLQLSGSFSGSFQGDGSGLTNIVAVGTLSSSAQIASDISGSFGAPSASFSTRTTTLENKIIYSGSFSGSFEGNGSGLTNIPAAGIVGLNLSQITSGSSTATISPDKGLQVNTSISSSIISGSTLVIAPTGSFNHIITDDETIEFRNKSTGAETGRLKFDASTGLNVQDAAGARTKIRAGRGEFLSLEAGPVGLNSIGPLTGSIISASSTIFANDIEAFRMNVTHLTSSFITASTIETSGSNIFGDESSDTHTFIGDIIARNNISSSGYISASNFIGDGSQLSGVDSIYTANSNILETRIINDRDGGFTGSAGSNALKMNVRNSGALLVAGYQNNGNPGTTNHLIQWGPGATNGGMNVRGKLGLTSGGGRIDLTNSGGSQYFTVAQSGITSLVSLSATNITGSNISASGIFTGDGSGLINIPASGITGLNLSQIASGSATASIAPDKGLVINTNISASGFISASHIHLTGGENSVITVPNSTSGFTFAAAGGNSTVDIFGTDFTSNLVKVPIEGKFQINSYNTILGRNYLQLYSTAYLTGTTAGYFTIAGTTGTSFNIGARLGVIGTTNDDAASAFKVQNSDSVNILDIVNDKNIRMSGSLELTGSLDIKGINNNLIIGSGSGESITEAGAGVNNIILGNNAATGLTTGEQNVIIGDQAASAASFNNEGESVVIGYEAGGTSVGSGVDQFVAIGTKAGQKFGGYRDVVIGYEAGANNDGSAGLNVAIGYRAGKGNGYNSGNNVWIGADAGQVINNADNNVGIGSAAGLSITNAQNNVLVGYRSGFSITTSDNNTLLGYQAGYELTSATSSIVIGYDAADGITTMDRQLFIGSGSTALISGSLSGGLKLLGQVSASSYIGDGSGLTGIVTATNFTQSLFVSPSGDNSTAAVGDMMKPFATILGATGSANPGDTIIVYPGTYIENNNLYKDGVNYHFIDGAKVVANSPVEPMWGGGSGQSNGIGASSNFSSSISITGHGEFISTSSNAMASAIFYIRVPSGVIEFKKATKHGVNAGPYQCLSAFGQWSAEDSTGTLTIRGSLENSGSISSYSSVASFHDGNINTDIVVRQHGGTGDGVRLWNGSGDINGTMDVYSEGYCLYTAARTSPLSYLKGRFETLTSNQGTYYALYFGSGYRGNFHVDAEVRGAIYIGPGDIYEGSVHVRGYQEVSNSPGGGAVVIASGQNQLSQRIYGASSNAIFKITGGQTTFDGTVRPTGYNSKVFDISAGTFNWKGTCTGNASYPTTRTDPNVVSGGELVIESQFECFSQAANVNDEYMFNLSGGTLDIQSKLRNNVNQANNGIIDMTGGYLRMNGAELVHATKTGSFAYAIDLNGQTHSGSILNNCFTNLTPFGNTGSFTNEIVGGGTLFESHKLY